MPASRAKKARIDNSDAAEYDRCPNGTCPMSNVSSTVPPLDANMQAGHEDVVEYEEEADDVGDGA